MTPLLAGILAYVAVQLGIGVWVSRRIETEDDFLVAGRRFGAPIIAFSIFATWFGAETCVSAAGGAYEHGVGASSVEPYAYGLCLVFMGLIYASPLWKKRVSTIADFLRQRFGPWAERTAAIILIPTSVLWAAAQVRAFGQVLSASSPLALETAIAIAAGFAILYTTFGGLLADVYTDVVQGVALVIGLVVVAGGVIAELGGIGPAAAEAGRLVAASHEATPGALDLIEMWALPIVGSVTAQEALSRSFAARSSTTARRAGVFGGGAYLVIGSIPVFLGLVGSSLLPDLEDGEQILPALAMAHLPNLLYILFAGALVSAILSTVDSALLVASSLVSRNLAPAALRSTERRRLILARTGVVGFGLIAWVLARRSDDIFELVQEASGFGSAGVFIVVTVGLFTRFGGRVAALASLIAGVVVWILAAWIYTDTPWPYLASLAAAALAYAAGALVDRGWPDRSA